jgi:RNA polymerase sigma-70 factor, ECF subfamily
MILADHALAQDAVQQAFTRVLSRGHPADIRSLKGFLHTMVRNECYRLLEKRRERGGETSEPLLEPVGVQMERGEEQERLERALRALPPEQREIVHLKIYEQRTFAEIAEALRIPANTAASRYRLALTRLRELLPISEVRT